MKDQLERKDVANSTHQTILGYTVLYEEGTYIVQSGFGYSHSKYYLKDTMCQLLLGTENTTYRKNILHTRRQRNNLTSASEKVYALKKKS